MSRFFHNLGVGLILLVLLTASACASTGSERVLPTPADEEVPLLATVFTLSTLDGETINLADLQGSWVLVNFWATWCGPCRDEMPYLNRLAESNPDTLVVLGVNMREDAGTVSAFLEEVQIDFPILMQPDNATLLAYMVRGLPLTVLISPTGEMVDRFAGQLDPARMKPWLESRGLVAARSTSTHMTGSLPLLGTVD